MARCVSSSSEQPLEPLATLFQPVAFGGHEGFAPLEFRFPILSRFYPGVAFANEFLLAAFQLGFASLTLVAFERLLAGQRLFAFFDEGPDVRQLLVTQSPGGLPLLEIGAVGLMLPAQLVLSGFDFLPRLLQMFLLEADAILEQVSFLFEPAQLLAVLVFELLLFIAEAQLAGLDPVLEVLFDAGADGVQIPP